MLKTIDRYIIKKYLGAFFFSCMLFSLISVVVDFSDKVDKFVRAEMPMSEIWGVYYLNFIPYINGLLWPLFSLISVIFITSRLASDSEVISILNAGVSYNRFLRPFVLSAFFIGGIHLVGNHFIIPKSNEIRYNIDTVKLGKNKDKGKYKDVHLFLAPDQKIFVRNYFKSDSTARNVRLEQFKDGVLTGYIKAQRMRLIKSPNTWKLTGIQKRLINPDGQEIIYDLGKTELDTMISLRHTDFIKRKNDKEVLTSPELREQINDVKSKGAGNGLSFEMELLRRTADAVSILILTIIGVAIASRKVRGGMGFHLAVGILLGALFIFMSKFSVTFASSELIPGWLGVWLPNFIFTIVAFWLVFKAQK